ncbi:UDP-N-acetylmuramate dehydrogenase [Chryseolinea sp. T2]|uniref:UDP-N-acetylmuramate dehydrogenase n=1 Tax=Chryseolinea sp. T2 TaxID=3129255 RepID=UPI00307804BA
MILQENVDLRPYTTFGIKAAARYFTTLRSNEDVHSFLNSRLFLNGKHLILGGGSNMLFTGDYAGLVARMELKGIRVVDETQDHVTLYAAAGENWHDLVMYCVAHNYGGIENLSLIPGTTGAAPMQNIGAYGVEIKDVITSVEAVDKKSGEQRTFSNKDCAFGYRESIFKQEAKDQYLINGITLRLTKRNHVLHLQYGAIQETLNGMSIADPTIRDVSNAVIHIRQSKLPDPAKVGNAGSFFKNPSITVDAFQLLKEKYPSIPSYPSTEGLIKVPAGWLIEQCGWKGKRFENIGVHPNQALVLVNYGGGDGGKIWDLAMQIRDSVIDKFNITLHPEVNIVMQ